MPDLLTIAIEAARKFYEFAHVVEGEEGQWRGLDCVFCLNEDGHWWVVPRRFLRYAEHVRVDA